MSWTALISFHDQLTRSKAAEPAESETTVEQGSPHPSWDPLPLLPIGRPLRKIPSTGTWTTGALNIISRTQTGEI